MNTRLILTTVAGALLWLPAAQAGSRSGGTGATAVTIPADTISTGGGQSSAGTGSSAVTVTASMGGIIGTVTAATPAVTNKQGYIPQILPAGFDLWASQNIPSGRDRSFNGDWNGDGIRNGIAYVFGNTPVSPTGKGKIPVPPSIPADVNVYLDRSLTLDSWTLDRVRWVNGAAPTFANANWTIAAGEVVDSSNPSGGKSFYRYRVVRR